MSKSHARKDEKVRGSQTPRPSTTLVEASGSQRESRKAETLTIMGKICSKALQIIDGTRLRNNGDMLPPMEIVNESTTVVRRSMRSAHPSAVMRHPYVNINSTQRTVSEHHCGRSLVQRIQLNQSITAVHQHVDGGIKPRIGALSNLYDRLMTLEDSVLDHILSIINEANRKKAADEAAKEAAKQSAREAVRRAQQHHRRQCASYNDSTEDDDEADDAADDEDYDEDDDEDEEENADNAYGLNHHTRHHSKKIDYASSVGFRNYVRVYRKKHHDAPLEELVKYAKEAYKSMSLASRYRYRNLQRYKVAGIANRHGKMYSDSGSS